MGIFFSKRKSPTKTRVSEHDKAVLKLKQQRDNIKRYQIRVERTLENDRTLAKTLLSQGKKDQALVLLRKKRYQEKMLQDSERQIETLEKLVGDIEYSQIELKVIEGMKVGNDALTKLNNVLSIEDIEKIMDETKEGIEKQQEISDLIGNSLSTDDDEMIEEELEQLMLKSVSSIPEIPSDQLPEVKKEKEGIQKERKKIALQAE